MDTYKFVDIKDAENWKYGEIVDSFAPFSELNDGPAIAASGLEDSIRLRFLLERASLLNEDDEYLCMTDQAYDYKNVTPLVRAIERRLPENDRMLPEDGANPDGAPLERQLNFARRFRRFHTGDRFLRDLWLDIDEHSVGPVSSQVYPPGLTDDELAERRSVLTQFWTSPFRLYVNHSEEIAEWHSASSQSVAKAGWSTPDMLDLLLDAEADTSAWREPFDIALPEEDGLKPSQLSVSTPIHAAIAKRDIVMLHKLFDSGISPNACALVTGSQALTPAQYAITLGDVEIYSLLLAKGADSSIVTPLFNVHALHFAAAQLRDDLLETVGLLSDGGLNTAMGHSLLHVACLPFDQSHIRTSAPKISQSIHDIRRLSIKYKWHDYNSVQYTAFGDSRVTCSPTPHHNVYGSAGNGQLLDSSEYIRTAEKDIAKQDATCRFLISKLGSGDQIPLNDKHDNNMFHYLASVRYPNTLLIDWLRQQEGGMHAWVNCKNLWSFTPLDLYQDGMSAQP